MIFSAFNFNNDEVSYIYNYLEAKRKEIQG
jgi:hypothetical protein